MKAKILLTLMCTGLLAACNSNLNTKDAVTGMNSSSSSAQESSISEKVMDNLAADLGSGATGSIKRISMKGVSLSSAQVTAILAGAEQALAAAGLSQSNNLSAVLPVLIQGATSGLGGLNLSSANLSSLLALIGNSSLNSAVDLSSGAVSTALIEKVTSSLFANLGLAGVTSLNATTISSSVISSLLASLAGTNIDASSLSTLVQSIASGSVKGINSSSFKTILSTLMTSLGSGSLSGLNSLLSLISGSANQSDLATLIQAFTTGTKSGLAAVIANNSVVGGLVGNLLTGVNGAATGTSASSWISTLIGVLIKVI